MPAMAWNSTRCNSWQGRLTRSQAGDGKPFPVLLELVLHTFMCDTLHMATNLAIDDGLIEEARKTGGHRTKKEAVTTALQEYISRHRQQQILADFGTVDFDPKYDYKAERRRKRQ
jgi:Arc/MetJ family transcription regulator